jgi:hypothetical protein
MNPRAPYDTLLGKSKETIAGELEQLIGAAKITLAEGGQWLVNQHAPRGPVMRERDVSLRSRVNSWAKSVPWSRVWSRC